MSDPAGGILFVLSGPSGVGKDAAIDRIVKQVLSLGERELPARQIGGMVMNELKRLDKIAYIRFASVYKSFQDVDDFRDVLKDFDK